MNTYSLALASFAIISAAALPTASNPLNQFVPRQESIETNSSNTTLTDDVNDLQSFKKKTRTLYFVVGALILVICLLLLGNVYQCVRRSKRSSTGTYAKVETVPQTRAYTEGAPVAYSTHSRRVSTDPLNQPYQSYAGPYDPALQANSTHNVLPH